MPLETTASRIEAYIRLRDYKREAEKKFKESMQRVNDAMARLEAELLDELNRAGTDSVAVKGVGTAYRITRESASVQDAEAFRQFVIEGQHWELADLRANKTAIKEYMDTCNEPVPGVNFTIDATIGIRKG